MNIFQFALRRAGSLSIFFCAFALSTSLATAGSITNVTMFGPFPGTGPGLGSLAIPIINTFNAANDNVPAPNVPDNNIAVPLKRFDNVGYIDIEFFVTPTFLTPADVTEYTLFESVDNNTFIPWNSYTFVLGFGTGAGFVQSIAGDGLDFDFPTYYTPPSTNGALTTVTHVSEDEVNFSGGIHGLGAQSYVVRLDVPNIPTSPNFSRFTLRQYPTAVPEPSTWVMLGLAAVGAIGIRMRRQ